MAIKSDLLHTVLMVHAYLHAYTLRSMWKWCTFQYIPRNDENALVINITEQVDNSFCKFHGYIYPFQQAFTHHDNVYDTKDRQVYIHTSGVIIILFITDADVCL